MNKSLFGSVGVFDAQHVLRLGTRRLILLLVGGAVTPDTLRPLLAAVGQDRHAQALDQRGTPTQHFATMSAADGSTTARGHETGSQPAASNDDARRGTRRFRSAVPRVIAMNNEINVRIGVVQYTSACA